MEGSGRAKGNLVCGGHGWRVSAATLALGRAECHFLAQAAIPRAALRHVSRANTRRLAITPGRGRGSNAIAMYISTVWADRRRAPGCKRSPCLRVRFSRGKGASRGFDRAIQRQPRTRHFSRNGSPICRNRPRADAAPPAANVCPRAVRTRLDDLVHAADRAVAHRRQILASPRAMGRFPRRRARHGRICGVGVPVRGAGELAESGLPGARAGKAAWPAHPSEPNLWGIALLLAYFLVRTAFLTTVEAPEPRYVVSCYPGVLALIALLGIRKEKHKEAI